MPDLPRLEITEPLFDKEGRPTKRFQKLWDQAMSGIELQVGGIQEALDQIASAQADIELLFIQQDDFNEAIVNLIVIYDGLIGGLQTQVNTINSRLTAAGIP